MKNENQRLTIKVDTDAQDVSFAEISALGRVSGSRLNPLRHELIYNAVLDYASTTVLNVVDACHSISRGGLRYMGLVQLRGMSMHTINWIVGIENYNDGHGAMSLHSGFVAPAAGNVISFHASRTLLKKVGFFPVDNLQGLVNENLTFLREHFNLEFERMDTYKSIKLSREQAHDIICHALTSGIIAGRVAFEFITKWHSPGNEYLAPRTLWTLFLICNTFASRFKAPELIERTTELHAFFDSFAKFNKKPTAWVQSQFV